MKFIRDYSFFLLYGSLLIFSYFSIQVYLPESNSSIIDFHNLRSAVALSSLTHLPTVSNSTGLTIFSLFITQISGLIFLSYLLWYCWKLFGSEVEKNNSILKAFRITGAITFIIEIGLFLFFMYGMPKELTDHSLQKKVLAALSMAINSFNNAGFSMWSQFFYQGFVEQNFILQIGVIGGSVLGSLGIFVIYELLSPKKLRERLHDHTIDWSFITKVSVYGTALILITGSLSYYVFESNHLLKDKIIIESAFGSIYEVCAARGFGFPLFENSGYGITQHLKTAISIFGGGPFSTAGGLTIMVFAGLMSTFIKKKNRTANINIAISLSKNLLYYYIICFIFFFISNRIIISDYSGGSTLYNQIAAFTNTGIYQSSSNEMDKYFQVLAVIAGRIGFIVASILTLGKFNN